MILEPMSTCVSFASINLMCKFCRPIYPLLNWSRVSILWYCSEKLSCTQRTISITFILKCSMSAQQRPNNLKPSELIKWFTVSASMELASWLMWWTSSINLLSARSLTSAKSSYLTRPSKTYYSERLRSIHATRTSSTVTTHTKRRTLWVAIYASLLKMSTTLIRWESVSRRSATH